MRPLGAQAVGDGRRRIALLDHELDLGWGRSTPGWVSAVPRSSRTMSATNGRRSAAGLSSAHDRIALLTTGRSAVKRDEQHDPGQEDGEQQEPDEPAEAAAATATPTPPPPRTRTDATARSPPGRSRSRRRRARSGGRAASLVARASARADRHGVVSIVGRAWADPGRAAAVEFILQDDRRGFPVDPRTVRVALRTRWAVRPTGRGSSARAGSRRHGWSGARRGARSTDPLAELRREAVDPAARQRSPAVPRARPRRSAGRRRAR